MIKRLMSNARGLMPVLIALLLVLGGSRLVLAQGTAPEEFPSAKEAVEALIGAARAVDEKRLMKILGSETREWILSGDPVQDRQGLERFVAAYDEKHELEKVSDNKFILSIGNDGFPFPFPIISQDGGWAFDPEQGREELLDRRIGRNELNTIQVLLAIVDAQQEYASVDRNGDGLVEYASKFRSSDGQQDGLYWPTAAGQALSPLGSLVADAVREGYTARENVTDDETGAYHGYHFKLLSRQGPDAPGGAYDYMVDGKMVGGFAVLAYPTRYGLSGIMSFMVSHEGTVYEGDLGPDTATAAQSIDEFNPGAGWSVVKPDSLAQ